MESDFSHIDLEHYTYDLPNDRIAYYPVEPRDKSLQLIYKDDRISHDVFAQMANHIEPNSLLIFNDTKVINARLFALSETGAQIEFFILSNVEDTGIEHVLNQKHKVQVKCLIGNAKRFKGQIHLKKDQLELQIDLVAKIEDYFIIELTWTFDHDFYDVLNHFGETPLPPYIKRKAENIDKITYQTAMAKAEGSVAAPTAALHFSESVFQSFKARQIHTANLTLHVGAGTFLPIKTKQILQHEMHAETILVQLDTLHQLKAKPNQIIAIGTTSLRTLETLYWCAQKIKYGLDHVHYLEQWLAYKNSFESITYAEAIQIVIDYCNANGLQNFQATTQILIMPGYQIRSAKALVTNFHQPGSTLLLLVAAFIGEAWKDVYDYAFKNQFRFLSYGDSSILFRK